MKSRVKFLGMLLGAAVCLFSMLAVNASAKQEQKQDEIEGAEIVCSAGEWGRCFTYGDASTTIPMYTCIWTGRQSDNCTLLGVFLRDFFLYC